nr:B3 domain-containing protein, DNA-binding pseudobarrel domain protein [Tanacetum cinerariifolium]
MNEDMVNGALTPSDKSVNLGLASEVDVHSNKKTINPTTCEDALAALVKEPVNKKRTKRVKCEEVVTERLRKFITDEMNNSDLELRIQKVLYMSDLKPNQKMLNLPQKQLITEDFLSDNERRILESEGEIEIRLVGPMLKMYKKPIVLKMWRMSRTNNYVLKTKWKQFVEENKEHLKELVKIQLWSFRKDHQLCFALAAVARPPDGKNIIAN